MFRRVVFSVALATLLMTPAWGAAAEPTPAAASTSADQGTPSATRHGTTFTLPPGWTLSTKEDLTTIGPPEPDTHVALFDVKAKDADAAVAAGWAAYQPGFARPLKISLPQAPRDGWEERKVYQYETSPNERRVVQAVAWRAGDTWTVAIIDGSEPTIEKRGGPLSMAIASLRPKGYTLESFAGKEAHPLDQARLKVLQDFVAGAMKQVDCAGVGLAFIDHGKTVWAGGLGVKEMGKPDPIDAQTLFIAASNTKAFTTLLLAELADEKKLRWDEHVTELYPSFKLGDPATTKDVLVKHLVCACTGMPRQDMEWLFEYEHQTPASAMALLGTMQPTSKFGEVFQYSNLMAAAAGYIGGATAYPGKELGAAYDQAMKTKVFDPLGMTTATFDFAQAMRGNHASPHGVGIDGKLALAPMALNYSVIPLRPAGGLWTSSSELAKYVEMELAKGKLPNGERLVSEENLLARYAPQVAVSDQVTYGMALMVETKYGITVVHHGGDLAGYHSDMMWLPDHGVGAVILTNSDPGVLIRGPLLRKLLEVLFDGKPEADASVATAATQLKQSIAKERERLVVPADPASVVKLAARYTNASLGTVSVAKQGGTTAIDIGEWKSTVASRKNDDGTTSFITIDPTLSGFEFVVADTVGARRLVMRDAQHEYVFEEAKDVGARP